MDAGRINARDGRKGALVQKTSKGRCKVVTDIGAKKKHKLKQE
jgi:hypothetical protein